MTSAPLSTRARTFFPPRLPDEPGPSQPRAGRGWALLVALFLTGLLPSTVRAQISQVVFQDDFSSNTIDPAKYQPDAPFFEGGTGDIHAQSNNGTIEFVGTTTTQWWSGGTLRVAPTFTATEQANLSVSIDRVSEAGVGSASRTC